MKHILHNLVHIAIACLFIVPNRSFSQTKDSIDRYVEQTMKTIHAPGTAIAVIKNGIVIKEAYYGLANVEDSIPVAAHSVFEIASMSKQFTCTAILLLQQDGKISIEDKMSTYLDSLPAAWQNITIKQLMNHTSGMRDDWIEDNDYFLENNTDEKMFAAQQRALLLFKPGEDWNYSSGPFDLGLIIKKISGKSYAEFLEERIFKPLGMTSTSIYDEQRIVPHRVAGYIWDDSLSKLQRGYTLSAASIARGDVGVITSLPDMIKWNAAIKTNSLLTAASRKQMLEPARLNNGLLYAYGFGWLLVPQYGNSTIEHSGGFRTGYGSDIYQFPDIDLDVIILTNKWGSRVRASRIARLIDTTIKLPSQMKINPDPNTSRTQEAKNWIEKFVTNPPGDSLYYKKIFLDYYIKEIRSSLKDQSKNLQYFDEFNSTLNLFGTKIAKTIYYKLGDSARIKFLSFNYDEKGKLVYVMPEDDY